MFFCAFDTLTVDDARGRARLAPHRFAAFDVQGVVDAIQRPVIVPKVKLFEQRAARRKILGHGTPLATGAHDVHQAVHHFPDINAPLAATTLGCRIKGAICAHSSAVTSLG